MSRSRESKTLVEIVESFSDINQRACSIAIGYWKWLFFDNSVSVAWGDENHCVMGWGMGGIST